MSGLQTGTERMRRVRRAGIVASVVGALAVAWFFDEAPWQWKAHVDDYFELRESHRKEALLQVMAADEPPDVDRPPAHEEWDGPRPSPGPDGIGSVMRMQIAGFRLADPVDIAFRQGDPRPFVAGQSGLVAIVGADGAALPEPFFDLSRRLARTQGPGNAPGCDAGDPACRSVAVAPDADVPHAETPESEIVEPEITETGFLTMELVEAESSDPEGSDAKTPDAAGVGAEVSGQIMAQDVLVANGVTALAFHPRFETDRRVFLGVLIESQLHLFQYSVPATTPDQVDYASEKLLFQLPPARRVDFANRLEFGPDGRLYVGIADEADASGAGALAEKKSDDGDSSARDPDSFFGKLLALDVEREAPVPQVVARGLRNPWQFSFDPHTGDLYLADDGAERVEELNVIPFERVAAGGLDFGWNRFEGTTCLRDDCDTPADAELWSPVFEYPKFEGCNISGGVVYRGDLFPELRGHYFFSDLCSGFIRSLKVSGGEITDYVDWTGWVDGPRDFSMVTAMKAGPDGELYVALMPGVLLRMIRVSDPFVPNRFVPPAQPPGPHRREGSIVVSDRDD